MRQPSKTDEDVLASIRDVDRHVKGRMQYTEAGNRIADAMMSNSTKLAVGDTVVYTARFLKASGIYTGDLPFAQGLITAMTERDPKLFGGQSIVSVDWGAYQSRALEYVLIRRDRRHLEAR